MSSQRQTLAVAAAAASLLACTRGFVSLPAEACAPERAVQRVGLRGGASAAAGARVAAESGSLHQASLGLAACTLAAAATARRSKRAGKRSGVARKADEDYGEDLSVPQDSFCVVGVAHCFEMGEEGKLQDKWILEPVNASSVEVVNNSAETSYEAFMGTTVGTIMSQDMSKLPKELFCGHEVSWASELEFRTGCAARTWMRDHARDVVRLMVPMEEVKTGFNTSIKNKRILNFVNEVKDSDNVKQDMSIDVYGREGEEEDDNAKIADLYNV